MLGEESEVEGTWKDISMEKFAMGEESFNEGTQDFLALLQKKQYKNKYLKFFQLKVSSSIKT